MADEQSRPKRLGTVYGDRGENRTRVVAPPKGVAIVPAEFAEDAQPITKTGMEPLEELGARIERSRSATKSSELTVTSWLRDQDKEIAAIKTDVTDVKEVVTTMQVDVAGLKPLVGQLQKSADRLAERDDLHFKATLEVNKARELGQVQVTTAQGLDVVDARKQRRRLALQVVGLLGAGGGVAELIHWLVSR